MKILVINAGSSSIKYQLFEMPGRDILAKGMVERIGQNAECLAKWIRLQQPGDQIVAGPVARQRSYLALGLGSFLVAKTGR